jgi:anti-sigma factor RsiW
VNCKGVIRELSNYIDGELEPAIKLELERHLSHCEDCTMILDQTKKSIEILCDSEPIPLPAGLHDRLRSTLRERLGKKPGSSEVR